MRNTLVCLVVILLAAGTARADEEQHAGADKGTFGVGLMFGEPFGVCARLYLSSDQALQGAVGPAFFGGGFGAHADYVFHPKILQTRDSFVLAAYLGPGARVIQYRRSGQSDYIAIGLRVVGGLLFDFKNPLDAFVEVAGVPEYGFGDNTGLGITLNAAAGVRYYF
jgi:hypothetical protein